LNESPLKLGRIVGALMLALMIGGMLVNVVLFEPVLRKPPGWLVNASAHSFEIGLLVPAMLATDAIWLAIAIACFPLFRTCSERMTLAFIALASVNLALAAVESASVLSMLSLSEAHAEAGGADPVLFETLRGVVGSERNWAHYTRLVAAGTTMVTFFGLLLRFALVPRAFAGFGLGASALQIVAVGMPFFGQDVIFALLGPLALAVLSTAGWLLVRGFRPPAPAAAPLHR
jgi:Domain of unknown function (DUF4386)